ncbi:hypothetical protein MKZ38_003446 [Zalerion maritima]|uniref:Uncharacterized protein n=1 Tax=Zalerion maritima TaxID=339359 RepID=A0AAD5RUE4_9PEZI|nr:hypothetical protein MKZ38_003446 [Zalerion maritima]
MGTPVKVPPAASSYSNATQDPDLRSQVNQLLLSNGDASKIQDHLLHSLDSHPTNWPQTVQAHALSLLRSGEFTTFPALLRRVLDDIKQETQNAATSKNGTANGEGSSVGGATTNGATTNGTTVTSTGPGAPMPKKAASLEAPPSLAVPNQVVEDALKATQDCLEKIVRMDD